MPQPRQVGDAVYRNVATTTDRLQRLIRVYKHRCGTETVADERELRFDVPALKPATARGTGTAGDMVTLSGTPHTFGVKWQPSPGLYERFASGSFDSALRASPALALVVNHSPDLLLSRTSNDTLNVWATSTALRFQSTFRSTAISDPYVALIEAGTLAGMSFSFTTEADSWDPLDDFSALRTVTTVGELFDISPVTFPAFRSGTSVVVERSTTTATSRWGDYSDDTSDSVLDDPLYWASQPGKRDRLHLRDPDPVSRSLKMWFDGLKK
jgi:HK97 family phage prohead protease